MPLETNGVIGINQLSEYDALMKNYINTHGSGYVLPPATQNTLGGIKVGSGLSVTQDGTLSATGGGSYILPTASASTLGGIKVGERLSIDANGVLSAADQSYTLPIASDSSLGGVKISTTNGLGINSSTGMLSLQKATSSQFGGVKVGDGLEGNAYTGVLTLKKASTSQLGGVKVDGTTIKADSNGVLSSIEPDYVIATPKMTSNTAPYGECIYSTQYSGSEAYRAFERNTSRYWRVDGNEPRIGSWIGYHFPNPVCITKLRTTNCGLSTTVKSFKLQGSDDGSTWTDIQSCTISSSSTNYVSTFDISNTTYYSYYRLYITNCFGSGDYMTGINEIEFLETIISQDGKGSGSSYTLPTASANTLGGIKVGSGLSIAQDGTLSTTGSGGASSLDDLSDVEVSNPSSGQILKYNSTISKFENADVGPYIFENFISNTYLYQGINTSREILIGEWDDRPLYAFAFKRVETLPSTSYSTIKQVLRGDVNDLVSYDISIVKNGLITKKLDDSERSQDFDEEWVANHGGFLGINIPFKSKIEVFGIFYFTKIMQGDTVWTNLYDPAGGLSKTINKNGLTITFSSGGGIHVEGTATADTDIYSEHTGATGSSYLPELDVQTVPMFSRFAIGDVSIGTNESMVAYLYDSNDDILALAYKRKMQTYGCSEYIEGSREGNVNVSYIKLHFSSGASFSFSLSPYAISKSEFVE